MRDRCLQHLNGTLLTAVLGTLLLFYPCDSASADTDGNAAHQALLSDNNFPSAKQCAACHPQHYKEWSVSPHAYAQISPVFNAMHAKLIELTNGTTGDFCIRCHTPVGMELKEPLVESNLKRDPVSVEGVTCVTCHRRSKPFGKTSGRYAINHGDIFAAVYGPKGGEELRRVIESGEYDIVTDPDVSGRKIHRAAFELEQISTSAFCGTCHDVNSSTGFRLEEAFSEYKSAPAARDGVSCQDCHMSTEPGKPSGYEERPVAIVGGKPTKPRKRTNHMFIGPDYSIVHPGIFPHNPAAARLASMQEWLEFDYRAGWGTDEFEDAVPEDYRFPERWQSVSDRYEARDLLEENIDLLKKANKDRLALLQEGYQLGDISVRHVSSDKLRFDVEVKNGTTGHNVPTGFDAERLVFLRVTVTDANGKTVFISGDLDPNGDVRDAHSVYVHDGKLPRDKQLFSLQSKFVIDLVRGGQREEVLAVNQSLSPLPFQRPPTRSTLLTGRPAAARKHRQSIPPLASRWASYTVNGKHLRNSAPPYKAKIELVAGMVPVNLIYEIQDVGFDYGMSPRSVADAVVQGHQILWQKEVELNPETAEKG